MIEEHVMQEDARIERNCWMRRALWANAGSVVVAGLYLGLIFFVSSSSSRSEWIVFIRSGGLVKAFWGCVYAFYFPQLLRALFAGHWKKEALLLFALLCQIAVFSVSFMWAMKLSPLFS